MDAVYEYLDEMNPLIPMCVTLGMYLILRYYSKKALNKKL